MKTNKFITVIALAFSVILLSCSDKQNTPAKKDTAKPATQHHGQAAVKDNVSAANVLQVAMSLDDFKTLVVAVQAAGVEDALVNTGPLTVFAPINSAFDKLPAGTVETLLKPENKAKLAFILVNHVAPSNYPIKQLKKEARKGRKLYMASGKYLVVENKADGIYVGGTKILKSVKVSNGWIHVIGDILVPSED
ncbi:MAG: fasciclin domain-containing protein [Flavobacteriaceae bacterium]|nr:fasciclin domain-containing protein [Flavobacteriaceae bacterium]